MATSSFEREFVISDPEAVRRFYEIIAEDEPSEPYTRKTYSYEDRVRCKELLRQYLSRSGGRLTW